MSDNVVPFPTGLSRPEAESLIRKLASDSKNIGQPEIHFQAQMLDRDFSMRQVLQALREGSIVSDPLKDEYGDWRCVLKKRCAGRLVRLVVAIHERSQLILVTIY